MGEAKSGSYSCADPESDTETPATLSRRLGSEARRLGFLLYGVTGAGSLEDDGRTLVAWLEEGSHGQMGYMEREPARRWEPARHVRGARSVVCLGHPYPPPVHGDLAPGQGRVASYAWGRDYHKVVGKKLLRLERFLTTELVPGARSRRFLDSGSLLERAFARRAGLGFIGKNTMLIHRRYGSSFFLAALVTDVDLPPDRPVAQGCGSCTLCLDACPTGALDRPWHLDARRCLSYLTIEVRGPWPPGSPAHPSGWVFGCDDCQSVCPYNRNPWPEVDPQLLRRDGVAPTLDLDALEALDAPGFLERFAGSPLMRARRDGMVRNVRAVRGQPRGEQVGPVEGAPEGGDVGPAGSLRREAGLASRR